VCSAARFSTRAALATLDQRDIRGLTAAVADAIQAKASGGGESYTRSTPSYEVLSEYNSLFAQRLTSYTLVLVGLPCGSSSFAKVTNELPTSRNMISLHRKSD
jgi:hypothetical protein